MAGKKPPRVVAELGRPETAAETRARKSRDSRLYRERKTVNNLVFSLLVSLAAVLLIVLMVPRGKGNFENLSVDVARVVSEASAASGHSFVAPKVAAGWKAKTATVKTVDGVTWLQINYVTAQKQYAAVTQAFRADAGPVSESWLKERLEGQKPTGSVRLAGALWQLYDYPKRDISKGNLRYGLKTAWQGDVLIVYGTAPAGQIRDLAERAVASLSVQGLPAAADTGEGAG